MKKGIHHCQPQCSQPALQQIPNHTAGLLWTQKSPRFPREVIRWLQGRLQGWFAKAKPEGSQNRTPLPPPGCKGAKAVAPALKGREIFFGQGKPELAALPPSWPFPEASLLLSALPLLLPGLLTEITIIISQYWIKAQQTSFLGDPSGPAHQSRLL